MIINTNLQACRFRQPHFGKHNDVMRPVAEAHQVGRQNEQKVFQVLRHMQRQGKFTLFQNLANQRHPGIDGRIVTLEGRTIAFEIKTSQTGADAHEENGHTTPVIIVNHPEGLSIEEQVEQIIAQHSVPDHEQAELATLFLHSASARALNYWA